MSSACHTSVKSAAEDGAMQIPASPARQQTATEEIANSISHGTGFLVAAAALPALLQLKPGADLWQQAALSAFALTMMLMFASSALFHGLPEGRAKALFERLDRAAIYLFIAGSYSAFAAPALQGSQAWIMLGLVWALACLGVLITCMGWVTQPLLSTGLYVVIGWLVLLSAMPWIAQISAPALNLLLAGGAAYTVGAVIFLLSSKLRFAHLAWHLLVMLGSGLHLAANLLPV